MFYIERSDGENIEFWVTNNNLLHFCNTKTFDILNSVFHHLCYCSNFGVTHRVYKMSSCEIYEKSNLVDHFLFFFPQYLSTRESVWLKLKQLTTVEPITLRFRLDSARFGQRPLRHFGDPVIPVPSPQSCPFHKT